MNDVQFLIFSANVASGTAFFKKLSIDLMSAALSGMQDTSAKPSASPTSMDVSVSMTAESSADDDGAGRESAWGEYRFNIPLWHNIQLGVASSYMCVQLLGAFPHCISRKMCMSFL